MALIGGVDIDWEIFPGLLTEAAGALMIVGGGCTITGIAVFQITVICLR